MISVSGAKCVKNSEKNKNVVNENELIECAEWVNSGNLPSGRSKPPADVARFFAPSVSSRSELRRVICVEPLYETFDIDVDRRLPQ